MKRSYLLLSLPLVVAACSQPGVQPLPFPSITPSAKPTVTPTPPPSGEPCATLRGALKRKNGTAWSDELALPASGKMYLESHIATLADPNPTCPSGGIDAHLAASCAILKSKYGVTDCSKVYDTRYEKQWTPPEPYCARGATSPPPVEQEMWVFNMMWSPKPPAGEKWLICNEAAHKCVVAAAGWETGPGSQSLLGGAQGEVHYFLNASNETKLTVRGKLVNQSVGFGPVECSE